MKYERFLKKFSYPSGFKAPQRLMFEDLVAKPLTRADLKVDMEAVNSSLEIIRTTRGGGWPEEAVSEDFNLLDLAWHEREFREDSSFAYGIYDSANKYIGCFYLYPVGYRVPLTEELLAYDVDASWWVTAEAYNQGYYEKSYKALGYWLTKKFPFQKVYYSNKEIPS